MILTKEILKYSCEALGYTWFKDINIIGIRTNINVPDVFNDLLCVSYEDQLRIYQITTEPGVHYQKTFLNIKGCAVVKPGQYFKCYSLGLHQQKPNHKALIQTGQITVYRDFDKDGVAEEGGREETGWFGCNIHGANNLTTTAKIGPWSAGCQVFQTWSDKEEFINICEVYKGDNKLTYTLLRERELIDLNKVA